MNAQTLCPCGDSHDSDAPNSGYYVSIINGASYCLALGPFATHADALARVNEVRDYVVEHYRAKGAWFWDYGTAKSESAEQAPGKLNAVLGVASVTA